MQEIESQQTQKVCWVYEVTQSFGSQTQKLEMTVSTRLMQIKTHCIYHYNVHYKFHLNNTNSSTGVTIKQLPLEPEAYVAIFTI